MPIGGGFYSKEQEVNFRAANVRHRRGGRDEISCGARTRAGAACGGKPLVGSNRCLRHAGPHAARAFRARQKRDYHAGRISHVEWTRAEAKRAGNRLRDKWKKNPWLPGSTIDLGEREWAFQHEAGLDVRLPLVPPAVVDFLRWKYRRLQIDRKRDSEWVQVLRDEFPRRVRAAGPAPSFEILGHEQKQSPNPHLWTVNRKPFSKREHLDPPKVNTAKSKSELRRVRVRDHLGADELGMLLHQYRLTLLPLLERCNNPDEQMSVLVALAGFIADPANTVAHNHWLNTLQILGHRS